MCYRIAFDRAHFVVGAAVRLFVQFTLQCLSLEFVLYDSVHFLSVVLAVLLHFSPEEGGGCCGLHCPTIRDCEATKSWVVA